MEQKQVVQQEVERSKFVVMKAEQEQRAAIIRAEGQSDAAKLISDATASARMGLIELRRIEASREIASTLAKLPNVSYLPGGQNLMMALTLPVYLDNGMRSIDCQVMWKASQSWRLIFWK